jgi:hypothetical protein
LGTSLTIRNDPPTAKERLRLQATLGLDSDGGENLATAIRRRFAPFGGVELDEPPAEFVGEPPDFAA